MSEQTEFQKVIVAHDGSAAAQTAAMAAIEIAQNLEYPIFGLYVVDEALIMGRHADYARELIVNVEPQTRSELVTIFEAQAHAALAWLREQGKTTDIDLTSEVMFGGLPDIIVRQASGARFLALGRRGHVHAGAGEQLGTHFQSVAHRTTCSLLAGGEVQRPIRRLLLAYDSTRNARHALTWTLRLQRALDAEVVVLSVQDHAADSPNLWLDEVRTRVGKNEMDRYHFMVGQGEPAAHIADIAQEHQVDLIVMGGYAHTAVLQWLIGSTIDQVLRATSMPVFIARAE